MGPPISLTYNTPCPRRIGTGGVVLSLSDLFTQVAHNPVLGLTCLLVLAVVLVNGWTDAPNAIATVVTTGVSPFRRAVALAAVCNLMGVLVMTAVSATVAETIYSIADFGPVPGRGSLRSLRGAVRHCPLGRPGLALRGAHQ